MLNSITSFEVKDRAQNLMPQSKEHKVVVAKSLGPLAKAVSKMILNASKDTKAVQGDMEKSLHVLEVFGHFSQWKVWFSRTNLSKNLYIVDTLFTRPFAANSIGSS